MASSGKPHFLCRSALRLTDETVVCMLYILTPAMLQIYVLLILVDRTKNKNYTLVQLGTFVNGEITVLNGR